MLTTHHESDGFSRTDQIVGVEVTVDQGIRGESVAGLKLESERSLPGGSVEIVYAVTGESGGSAASDAAWSPESQRGPGGGA